MRDIGDWLATLGLSRYEPAFRENDIDREVVAGLTSDDLRELGISSIGHRRKLLDAIAALNGAVRGAAPEPAAKSEEPEAPVAAPEAERRRLTVMFVDLVGSTALSTRLDPEDIGGVIRAYQNAVAGEIVRVDGHVAKFMGDGVMAYFGWPRAHEDEPERAVRAGLAVVDAVARLQGGGAPLACRIGVATGLVVVGELLGDGAAQERAVAGETPNLAARLQAVAEPGEVVISEATRALIAGRFEMAPLPPQALKGIKGSVAAFRVLGDRAQESRFDALTGGDAPPIVGRDQELALLLERWETARRGEGQAVMLVGEAGIGKSRIVRALEDSLEGTPHTRLLYQCSPFHADSAFWPIIQQLSRAARFSADDGAHARLDKLEALTGRDDAPLLADLLGLDGEARYGRVDLAPAVLRARTLQALTAQVLRLAEARPVAFLLEDVHWIDPTTLELLELTIDAVASAPVLMVLTSRPDNQPALGAHPHVTRLALNRLGRAGVDAIVERLGGAALPRATVEAIVARTDGVPLFVEELTKAVVESGETAVPASLHDSLMARLDRTPEVKEIAQCAACIGREFDLKLLCAATERGEAELRAGLDRLAAAELVFRRGVGESERYVFKHALVRDAAYESMLLSRRRAVHARLADALEATTPPEVVARHAEAAGRIDLAVAQYRRAGETAVARPAYHEAAAHFGAALRLIESRGGGPEALAVATRRGVALIGAEGYAAEQTVAAFAQARALLDRIGDAPEWPAVRYGGWVGKYVGADLPEAERLAREVLADCRDADPHAFLGVANRMLATSLTMAGRFRESLPHLAESVAFYDPTRDADHGRRYGTDSGTSAHVYSALARWVLGEAEASRDHQRRALEIAARPDHSALSLAYTTGHVAILEVTAGEADALDVANRVIDQSTRDGIEIWRVFGLIARCAARVAAGDPDGALADAEAGRAGLRRAGSRLFLGVLLRAEARAHIALGAREAAARSVAEMQAVIAVTRQRWDEADLRCVGAELALAHDDAATAEARYRGAIELAREQAALSWERRAAIPLARLMAVRGAAAEARDMLSAVQGAFAEGFETPDHRAAAALLAELARS